MGEKRGYILSRSSPGHGKSSGGEKKLGFSSAEVDVPGIVLVLFVNTIGFKPGGALTPPGPGAVLTTP